MVIEGCILIVLSILSLILVLVVQNIGGVNSAEIVDGVIISSNLQKKEVIINYTFNNNMYSSAYNCEVYANVGEMPPAGLKVQVSVNPSQPDKVVFMHLMREMGRDLSGRHDYIDTSKRKNSFSIGFLILMLFLAGIYLILHGLSII